MLISAVQSFFVPESVIKINTVFSLVWLWKSSVPFSSVLSAPVLCFPFHYISKQKKITRGKNSFENELAISSAVGEQDILFPLYQDFLEHLAFLFGINVCQFKSGKQSGRNAGLVLKPNTGQGGGGGQQRMNQDDKGAGQSLSPGLVQQLCSLCLKVSLEGNTEAGVRIDGMGRDWKAPC